MTDKPVIELSRREAMQMGATAVGVATVGLGAMPRRVAAQTVSEFISGTVVDGDGNPVKNVWVLADPHENDGSPIDWLSVLATQTDANGDYVFAQADLHGETHFYQVYCRFGTSSSPERAQENYPWVEAKGFSPTDITGLSKWYDATDLTGFDNGDNIATWPDEEGNDDLIQNTTSRQPSYQSEAIGGNPTVRFDDDFLDVGFTTLSQPNHIFVVVQYRSVDSSAGANEYTFDSDDGNNRELFRQFEGEWSIFAGSSIFGSAANTNAHIATALYNGASSSLRIDGTSDASGDAGAQGLGGLTVGASSGDSNFGPIDVGEVIVYDAELSTTDRDNVEAYLSDKWGIVI